MAGCHLHHHCHGWSASRSPPAEQNGRHASDVIFMHWPSSGSKVGQQTKMDSSASAKLQPAKRGRRHTPGRAWPARPPPGRGRRRAGRGRPPGPGRAGRWGRGRGGAGGLRGAGGTTEAGGRGQHGPRHTGRESQLQEGTPQCRLAPRCGPLFCGCKPQARGRLWTQLLSGKLLRVWVHKLGLRFLKRKLSLLPF